MKALREIAAHPEIEGVMIITMDGFCIASSLRLDIETDRLMHISAALALLASSSTNLTRCIRQGRSQPEVYIKGVAGFVLVMPINEEFLCVALCKPETKLGLIFGNFSPLGGLPWAGMDLPRTPLTPSPDPIIPRRPPGRLSGHARPEYDEDE